VLEWLGFVPVVSKPEYGVNGATMIEYAWRGAWGLKQR
jgi:hypothetical protein